MMSQRVQLSRKKGWRMPENTVRVCRPTMWGNPYKVGWIDHVTGLKIETRADAVRIFRVRVMDANPGLQVAAREHLAGKNLACWCPLNEPCHADVLLMMSNDRSEPTRAALSREVGSTDGLCHTGEE